MVVQLQLRQLDVPPGHRVLLHDVSWQEFEAILEELGEKRGEVDVTSKTQLSAYEALGVPEIWRYQNRKLQIYVLREGKYVESQTSPTFPNLPVIEGLSQFLEMSRTVGTSSALRAFRKWVREQKI